MIDRRIPVAVLLAILGGAPAYAQDDYTGDVGGNGGGNGGGSGGGVFDGLFGGSSQSGTKTTVTSGQGGPSIDEVQKESYDGPKARIAVARFTNKAHQNWWSPALGDGMADQLATALFSTNRYILLERQALNDVLREQDLGSSGRIRSDTAAPVGQIEGAELMIVGAVTEFEGNASGSGGSVGGGLGGVLGGNFGAIVGSIASGVQRAHMAIDVRVIDTRTSRVVAATSVEGEATDISMGGMLGGRYGGGALGGALSGWKNTPKEKALRMCIKAAVDFIVSKTPAVYMRYGTGATMASLPAPAPAAPSRGSESAPPAAQKDVRYAPGLVVRVSPDTLNMRDKPKTGDVIASLPQHTPLLIASQSGQWIEVKAKTGLTGWVAAWLVTLDPAFAASNFAKADGPSPIVAPPPSAAAPQGAPGGATEVKARLQKLKELFDAGLINENEYNSKRSAILNAL